MRTRSKLLVFSAVALPVLMVLVAPSLRAQAPRRTDASEKKPSSQKKPAESALTNADVIDLVRAGLRDSIVLSKIRTAPSEALDTSPKALVALKDGGAPTSVIEAVMSRSGNPPEKPGEKSASTVSSPVPAVPEASAAVPPGNPNRPASLMNNGQSVLLEPVVDVKRRVSRVVVYQLYIDSPGLAASTKTSDRRAVLQVRSDSSPASQYWLVKAKVLADKGVRTVKGGSLLGSAGPDEDWVLPAAWEKRAEGLWEVVAGKALEPGEYGLLRPGGDFVSAGTDLLFGFTVE